MNKKFFIILLFFLFLCSCAKNPQNKVFIKDNSLQIEKDKLETNSKKLVKFGLKILILLTIKENLKRCHGMKYQMIKNLTKI